MRFVFASIYWIYEMIGNCSEFAFVTADVYEASTRQRALSRQNVRTHTLFERWRAAFFLVSFCNVIHCRNESRCNRFEILYVACAV